MKITKESKCNNDIWLLFTPRTIYKNELKAITDFLRLQEEYGTNKSSGRPIKLNDREKRTILRTTSNSTININEIFVALMLQELWCGRC
uniref:Transposase n=1 Tax=Heterorhabditis bacteriophora TaxID=37862 RepID=A0A1I7X174_HETBA